jgi:hypothetical protein
MSRTIPVRTATLKTFPNGARVFYVCEDGILLFDVDGYTELRSRDALSKFSKKFRVSRTVVRNGNEIDSLFSYSTRKRICVTCGSFLLALDTILDSFIDKEDGHQHYFVV